MIVTEACLHFYISELNRNLAGELFVFRDLGPFCSVKCWSPWQERDMCICISSSRLDISSGLGGRSVICLNCMHSGLPLFYSCSVLQLPVRILT